MSLYFEPGNPEEFLALRYIQNAPISKLERFVRREEETEEGYRLRVMNLTIPWTVGQFSEVYSLKQKNKLSSFPKVLSAIYWSNRQKIQTLLSTYSMDWLFDLLEYSAEKDIYDDFLYRIALAIYLKDPEYANYENKDLGKYFAAAIVKYHADQKAASNLDKKEKGEEEKEEEKREELDKVLLYGQEYENMIVDVLDLCIEYQSSRFVVNYLLNILSKYDFPEHYYFLSSRRYDSSSYYHWLIWGIKLASGMSYLDILEGIEKFARINNSHIFDAFLGLGLSAEEMKKVMGDNKTFVRWYERLGG